MQDRASEIEKATARRDFLAGLVLENEYYLPLFERAEQELEIALAGGDKVAMARLIARKRAA